jgi:hypothetical protein
MQERIVQMIEQDLPCTESKVPELIGSFTALPLSEMMPVRNFITKLQRRLPDDTKLRKASILDRSNSIKPVSLSGQPAFVMPEEAGLSFESEAASSSNEEEDKSRPVTSQFTITKTLDKLKLAEPEALIYNLDVQEEASLYEDHFAFAAFVPPGKHCIIIRD